MDKLILVFLFLGGFVSSASAAIHTEEVSYKAGDTALTGYLAYDDGIAGRRPGILVVHEWWGNNEYAHKRARMLAELGYVALAIDMYGTGKVADHPKDATAFMKEATSSAEISKARFLAGLNALKNVAVVDAAHIGAVGYCFGGGIALRMAMAGAPLDGVVSVHGNLALPEQLPKLGGVKAKILICHGGADAFATPEQINSLKAALNDAHADYQFKVYEGAKHGFSNPESDDVAAKFNMNVGYNAAADEQSWKDMAQFFSGIFGAAR